MTVDSPAVTGAPTPPADAGHEALWMLNSLIVERATSEETAGAYTLHEQWVTADGNPPMHVHEHQDEAFLVLDGSIDVTTGDSTSRIEAGGFAFGPRGVPHTYEVTSERAHLLIISSPGGIESFFRELGTPAQELELPEPQAPDVATVAAVAAGHGITILPPPE